MAPLVVLFKFFMSQVSKWKPASWGSASKECPLPSSNWCAQEHIRVCIRLSVGLSVGLWPVVRIYNPVICLDGTGPGGEFPPSRSLDGGAKTQPFHSDCCPNGYIVHDTNYGSSNVSLITSVKYFFRHGPGFKLSWLIKRKYNETKITFLQ